MTAQNNLTPKSDQDPSLPHWNWTTKLVVALVLAATGMFLLARFQNILGPVLMSFILAYLFHPVSSFIQKKMKVSWRGAVTIVYIVLALVIIALLTWGGLALFEQIQNLIEFIQNNIGELPTLLSNLSSQNLKIGPFEISLAFLKGSDILSQAINTIQPFLGQAGSLMGKVVSGGANLLFWLVLMLLISYFILTETEGEAGRLITLKIPGYQEDMKRMGKELSLIWNSFIRGQLIVISVAVIAFTILLGSMGLQYFFGLALVAALGRFIPYVGAWITWITYGLVALLQNDTPFGFTPFWYAVLIIALALVVDNILDNILVPKVMSNALRVHPAAILLAALIGASLLGVIGVILAAPVLASLQLIVRYLVKKLTDKDPWEDLNEPPPVKRSKVWVLLGRGFNKAKNWIKNLFKRKAKKGKEISGSEKLTDEK
ncbi:MAG: AI-2E family transporter [Anaerolineaceae bacterium]|nr:AI-2E family transporter [Anaerolineaceae bacterium]